VLLFAGVAILLIFGQSKLFTRLSGTAELTASLKEDAARTKDFSARRATQIQKDRLTFGPVIERVIKPAAESTNNYFLDLDSGKFIDAPGDIYSFLRIRFIGGIPKPFDVDDRIGRWAQASGADIMIGMTTPDVKPALYGGSVSFPSFSFDKASVQDVLRQATETAQQQEKSGQPLPPNTLFGRPGFDGDGAVVFQTREGGMGILQITGFTENPRGVKLRYKLVQNSEVQKLKPETVTGQVTDQSGKPLANVRWRVSAVEEWRDGQWELIHNLGDPQWAFTDTEGRFTLTFQGKQRFDLQFASGEFAPVFVYEVSPETRDLKVAMKPGIPIRGTVIAPDSNRIPGHVRVELLLPCRDVWYQQETITDADGHFTFYACPPPTEPNKAIPSKWQISCAGTVFPFAVEQAKSIGMSLQVDMRKAKTVNNTNEQIAK
jgi:hypothetical protein